jgi:hypothetical protein
MRMHLPERCHCFPMLGRESEAVLQVMRGTLGL